MPEPASTPDAIAVPRLLAMELLHAAQLAGSDACFGWVGKLPQAPAFHRIAAPERPAIAEPWALFIYRPDEPSPRIADFASAGEHPCLTASLETRGVLQLRAWTLRDGHIREHLLRLQD